MPLLEISGLTKHFGGLRAVHDLVLHVGNDEIVGLIGPNGSGKTTVFNLVTGLYPATAGRVVFDHGRQELTGLPPHRITALGVARTFQTQRLFNHMTVLENILVGTHCRTRAGIAGILLGMPGPRAERRRVEDRAAELLGLFGDRLLSRAGRPAWTLSYANRRRLEIARALAADPRVLRSGRGPRSRHQDRRGPVRRGPRERRGSGGLSRPAGGSCLGSPTSSLTTAPSGC